MACFEQAAPHGGILVSAAFRDALLGRSEGYAPSDLQAGGGMLRPSLARGRVAARHAEAAQLPQLVRARPPPAAPLTLPLSFLL